MKKLRVLLVDDDEALREVFQEGLETKGFEVVTASSVREALSSIVTQEFDVLLSDLHMPDAGDGFTVVSAMRRTHPNVVTLVHSAFPAIKEAMDAIMLQADDILTKPISLNAVVEVIQRKLATPRTQRQVIKESVAAILERSVDVTIHHWMTLAEVNEVLSPVILKVEDRTGYLPKIMLDLIARLRLPHVSKASVSGAASLHGELRNRQGYTVPMVIEESRMLQVCVFGTLQKNLGFVDFSQVLSDVITIADECDSQLRQAMTRFMQLEALKSGRQSASGEQSLSAD